jgi:hypothetical protein
MCRKCGANLQVAPLETVTIAIRPQNRNCYPEIPRQPMNPISNALTRYGRAVGFAFCCSRFAFRLLFVRTPWYSARLQEGGADMLSQKQVKLAMFISQWTERRLSDVIRAMEDARSWEISAWTTEAEDIKSEQEAAQNRVIQEIDKRVAEAREWDGKRDQLMRKVEARLRPLSDKDGPLYRRETRNAWLIERDWTFVGDNICEKNAYRCKGYDAPTLEMIFQLEEADGIEGEYRQLYSTGFHERLKMNGIEETARGYMLADPREAELVPWPETKIPGAPN